MQRALALALALMAATAARGAFTDLADRLEWESTEFQSTLPGAGLGSLSAATWHPDHGPLLLNSAGRVALVDMPTMLVSSLASSATTVGDELCFGATMSVSAASRLLVYGGARPECFGTGGDGGMMRDGSRGTTTAHLVWEGEVTVNATTGKADGVVWTMTDLGTDAALGSGTREFATHTHYGSSLFIVGGRLNTDGDTIVEIAVPGGSAAPSFVRGFQSGGLLSDAVYWASVVVYQDLFYIYGGDLPDSTVIHTFRPATGEFQQLATTGGQIPSNSHAVGGAGYLFGSAMVYMNRGAGGVNPLRQLDLETLTWSNSFPTVDSQSSIVSGIVPVAHGVLADTPAARGTRPKIALFSAFTMFQLSPEGCSVDPVPVDLSCYPCPVGSYSRLNQDNGQQVCSACPSGYTSTESNSVECATPCPAGSQWSSPSSSFFTDNGPRDLCSPCAAGQSSPGVNAPCEVCPSGFVSERGGLCTQCPAGQSTDGDLISDHLACSDCPSGQYKSDDDVVCQGCPVDAVSAPGSTSFTQCVCPEGQAPFELESVELPRCGACPQGAEVCSSAWQGPGTQPLVLPAPGFWNSPTDPSFVLACPLEDACPGGAIGVCADGYEGDACANCAKNHFFFQDECVECPDGAEGLLVVVAIAAFAIAYAFYAVGGENPLSGLPISLSYFQTISLIVIIDLTWPTDLTKLWQALSVFSFNVDSASPECSIDLTYYDKVAIALCVPFFFLALFAALVHFVPIYLKNKGKKDKAVKARSKLIHGGLQLMDALYLPVVSRMVRFFVCDSVTYNRVSGDDLIPTTVETLFDDPSIDCASSEYQDNQVVPVLGILLIGCGVPLAYIFLLLRIKKNKAWDDYAPKAGFLYRNFSSKRWYWSVVILLRKVILAAIVAFESVGSSQGTAIGCLVVIFVFLVLQQLAKPYLSKRDNLHDAVNMIFEIITIAFGLVYNDEDDPSDGLVIAGGLVVGLGVCITLYFLIGDIIAKIRAGRSQTGSVVPMASRSRPSNRRNRQ